MIDENGYSRPTYKEILDNVITSLQERFGADIDVSPTSNFGVLARFQAALYNEIEQRDEITYNSAFVLKAVGVSLDRLAANYGINRNPETYSIVDLSFTGTPGYIVPVNSSYQTSDNYIFVLSEPVTLDSAGNGKGIAYATSTGSNYNVAIGTIKNQVQPVNDIFTVNNDSAAAGGSNVETDTELRERITFAEKGINSASYNGIVSNIRTVSGVKTVRIVENKTDQIDQYGNPPYSIHIYVLGGIKEEIAKSIFTSMAFGINTYGTVKVSVLDIANQGHDVYFDYANEIPILFDIKLTVNDSFPSNGVAQVKSQVKAYIESLSMGQTVRFSYIYKYIYDSVIGINVADVKIGKDQDSLAMADINLNPFDVASYNSDNTNVEV